jgi:hypothetical protein
MVGFGFAETNHYPMQTEDAGTQSPRAPHRVPPTEVPPTEPGWRPDWRLHVLAAVIFMLAGVWLTWPQAAVLGDAIVGGPVAEADGWLNVWNLWWLRKAMLSGENPFYTHLIQWPDGVPLGFHTSPKSDALLTLPVLLVAGPIAAYGVAVLLHAFLSGMITYLLALRVTQSWPGAFAGGLVVEMAPAQLSNFMHGHQQSGAIQWVALYLLALLHATEHPTLRNGIWLGLSVTLVTYTSWYHAVFIAWITLVWFFYHLAIHRKAWLLIRPWLVGIPIILVFVAPLFAGFVGGISRARTSTAHWYTLAQLFSVDLVDLVLPSALHPWWGEHVWGYQESLHPNSANWITTPGYVALLLTIVGLVACWRGAKLWAVLAGALLLYSFGPTLRINGFNTGIPMPFELLSRVPGVNWGHRLPVAANDALVPLGVIAAFGMRTIVEHMRGYARLAVVGVLLAALVVETMPPQMHLFRANTSPVYAALRDRPGALLIIPMSPDKLPYISATLRDQLIHERPIVGGYIARPPDYPVFRNFPLFNQLKRRACERYSVVPYDAHTSLGVLNYYNLTQIVVHAERLSSRAMGCVTDLLEQHMHLAPAQQEQSVTVYDVPEVEPSPFVFMGDGWHPIEHEGERTWQWMKQEGDIYLINTDHQSRTLTLHLRMQSFEHPRDVQLLLDGERHLGEITIRSYISRIYTLVLTLEPGQHRLSLAAPTGRDPGAQGAWRDISIAVERAWVIPVTSDR